MPLFSRILTEKVNTLVVEDFVEIGLEPGIADWQVLLKIDKIRCKCNNFCIVHSGPASAGANENQADAIDKKP